MKIYDLESIGDVRELVTAAQMADDPLVMTESGDECLVLMRPAIFERILFDNERWAGVPRESIHF